MDWLACHVIISIQHVMYITFGREQGIKNLDDVRYSQPLPRDHCSRATVVSQSPTQGISPDLAAPTLWHIRQVVGHDWNER